MLNRRLLIALALLIGLAVFWLTASQVETPDIDPAKESQAPNTSLATRGAPRLPTPAPAPTKTDALEPARELVPARTTATLNVFLAVPDERLYSGLGTVKVEQTPKDAAPLVTEQPWRVLEAADESGSRSFIVLPSDHVSFEVEADLPLIVSFTPEQPSQSVQLAEARLEVDALAAGEERSVTLELVPIVELSFFGRITEKDTGVPVVGARITSRYQFSPTDGIRADKQLAVSDGEGRFELTAPAVDSPAPMVAHTDGFGVIGFNLDRLHPAPDKAIELHMTRSAWLTVRLEGSLDTSTSRVSLKTSGYLLRQPDTGGLAFDNFFLWHPTWPLQFAKDRRSRVELPAHVPFELKLESATKRLEYGATITLDPGEQREVVWRIEGGVDLRGRLTDQLGIPIELAEIWLTRARIGKDEIGTRAYFQDRNEQQLSDRTQTGIDGRFAFRDVTPGRVWVGPGIQPDLTASDPVLGFSPSAQRVELPAGAGTVEIELVAQRGLTVEGSVELPPGAAPSEVFVYARSNGGGTLVGTLDPTGHFVIGPMLPGKHMLSAWSRESQLTRSEAIEVYPGDRGILIQLLTGATIAGSIASGDAHGATNLVLTGSPDGAISYSTIFAGGFSFSGLVPGTYAIGASDASARTGTLGDIEVVASQVVKDLVMHLEPGAWIRLVNAGPGVVNYKILSKGTPLVAQGLGSKLETKQAAPAGRVVVELTSASGKRETRELELEAGEEARVEFDLGE